MNTVIKCGRKHNIHTLRTPVTFVSYICFGQSVDPGQSMDCPAQTVDPAGFAQTIHGLSQALHDQLTLTLNPKDYKVGSLTLNTNP